MSIKDYYYYIKNLETLPEGVKDPLKEKHLGIMFENVKVKNEFGILIWTMIIFLFRTLLRVGHIVVSPHTLHSRDIQIFKWGALISVNSSKQQGSSHKIPISRSEIGVCPVYWLEKLLKMYPGVESDVLFSTKKYTHVT